MHYRAKDCSLEYLWGNAVEYMGSCRINGTISNFKIHVKQALYMEIGQVSSNHNIQQQTCPIEV
jgi:hypothetical protein